MADNPVAESSDEVLITETRQGDTHAYAELWKRHVHVGMVVARRVAPQVDAEDLVTEAFTSILETMRNGRGPTTHFRPYLVVTIKHLAQRWEHHREDPIGSMDDLEAEPSEESDAELEYLRSVAASAFGDLPPAWQDVLWYTEVVGLHPRDVAPLLGMSANSVASLSFRAREGFKSAWIQAQIADGSSRPCRATRSRLGDYVRGRLSARTAARVREHLDECAECDELASDAAETASHLAVSLAPFALGAGIGGAALTPSTGGQAVALAIPEAATVLASVGSRPFAEWVAPLLVPGLVLAGVGGGMVTTETPPLVVDSPVVAAPFEPGPPLTASPIEAGPPLTASPIEADSPGQGDVAPPTEPASPEFPATAAPATGPVATDRTPPRHDADLRPAHSAGASSGAGSDRAADARPGTVTPRGPDSAGTPPAASAGVMPRYPQGIAAALPSDATADHAPTPPAALAAGLAPPRTAALPAALPLDLPVPAGPAPTDISLGGHALASIDVTVDPPVGVPAPGELPAD